MASANDVVRKAQFPMLIYIYMAVVVLCVLAFRSVDGIPAIDLDVAGRTVAADVDSGSMGWLLVPEAVASGDTAGPAWRPFSASSLKALER